MRQPGCELCEHDGGTLVLSNEKLRIVLVEEPDHPGFVRVIWHDHVREMTDLQPADRLQLMQTVFAVEAAQREVLEPAKVNLASLGNVTPHLHWHVIPRFTDDARFPQPVWGQRQREPPAGVLDMRKAKTGRLRLRIAELAARAGRR